MANSFFEYSNPVAPGTTIRSDKHNSDMTGIESAFDGVETELNLRLKLPDSYSGDSEIPEQDPANKFIAFDAEGNVVLKPIGSLDEAVDSASTAVSAANSAESDAAAAADYAEEAGKPVIVENGATYYIPNGAIYRVIVCLGDAEIVLPENPGSNATYVIIGTIDDGLVDITIPDGHEIEYEDNAHTDGEVIGKSVANLFYLGSGTYRGA